MSTYSIVGKPPIVEQCQAVTQEQHRQMLRGRALSGRRQLKQYDVMHLLRASASDYLRQRTLENAELKNLNLSVSHQAVNCRKNSAHKPGHEVQSGHLLSKVRL